jgi:DNA-binding NarL/FixJ family response regulator
MKQRNIINDAKKNNNGYSLTRRELLILKFVAKGCTNKQIAEKLFVSIETIKTHVKNIFRKLEVNNRILACIKSESLINTYKG